MTMNGPAATRLASPRLRSLATRPAGAGTAEAAPETQEACELCGAPIEPEHRHLLDLDTRELRCTCRACSLLFDRDGAGGGNLLQVPDRRLAIEDFALPDELWGALAIPVEMAFFLRVSREGRVRAYYPSPMGPTESSLDLTAWSELELANPVLDGIEDDVEALLVNRARGIRGAWIVPIEVCYALIGTIRMHWKGLSGGSEVWQRIEDFFEELQARSDPVSAGGTAMAAPRGAAERSADG